MLYFRLSGIEIAQVKRLSLFKKHHVDAKITTLEYNEYMHVNLPIYDLHDEDVVNLYDYFQQAEIVKDNPTTLNDIGINKQFEKQKGHQDTVTYTKNGKKRIEYKLFPTEEFGHHFPKDQIHKVTYFDYLGHHIRQEIYDVRGFLSLVQTFGQDGGVNQESFYTPGGKLAIVCDYAEDDNQKNVISLVRARFGKSWHTFSNLLELRGFFLDCLNLETHQQTTFMSDKSNLADDAIYKMQTKAIKIVVRHSTHTYDPTKPLTSRLNDVILKQYQHRKELSAEIVSTKQQAIDMKIRFNQELPVYTIPVGYVSNSLVASREANTVTRKSHTMLAIARVNGEKRIEHMVEVVKLVRQTVKDAKLEIYGYVPDIKYFESLQQQIKKEKLENAISFHDFQPDLNMIYNQSAILLLTSAFESFNLAMLEGISHGVVPIAYDINYGPSSFIDNDENGFLIKNGDIHEMAKRVTELMTNEKLLKKMSKQSYKKAKSFSENNVWKLWQSLLIDNVNLKIK
ncbi:glycosyltransferase [Pediococcus ethanolidurans]|nr:glycosyltransferase [Pediococcus ethanolidurans]